MAYKGLLIFIIIGYLLYRVGKYVFGIANIFHEASQRSSVNNGGNSYTRGDSEIKIDKNPDKKGKSDGFKGGEYVDYEEI